MTETGYLYEYATGQPYPIENIEVPLVIIHGERDKMSDGNALQMVLSQSVKAKLRHFEIIPNYEHLDLVWAQNSSTLVFPKIHQLIQKELALQTTS